MLPSNTLICKQICLLGLFSFSLFTFILNGYAQTKANEQSKKSTQEVNQQATHPSEKVKVKQVTKQASSNHNKKKDSVEHTLEFTGQLGVDFSESDGNFTLKQINARGSLFKRWDNFVSIQNNFTYRYMDNGDIKFSDDFRDFLISNLTPLSRINVMFLGLYHTSYSRYIDSRWMTGTGLAWTAIRSKEHQMRLSLATAHEWTTLDNRDLPLLCLPPQW